MPTTPQHEITIIGAGIGGIGAAMALRRNGMDDFVILERERDIGGTWHINRYPDVAVDIPGISYQFSYEKNPHWSRTYPKGSEVKEYIDRLADKYELRSRIRLSTDVVSRRWDEENHLWRLTLGDGAVLTSRYVISAIGAFVEPRKPAIAGLDTFAGKIIQTQAWDDDYDLTGKRVAVVGTGATAVQLIPVVAATAGKLDVYQRRAIWVGPKADYLIPAGVQTALKRVPGLQSALRGAASALVELALVAISIYGSRIGGLAKLPEAQCRRFLHRQVDDPELREKLTPTYGFGCKRPSVSNVYYSTFTQSHVSLITDTIDEITPTGIRTADGIHREADVLVLATGFEMSQSPAVYRRRPIKGRNGFDLADFYENSPAKAYEGVSMPELPNTFTIFGPFSWSGSSWHVMVENVARHCIRVIEEARRRDATAVSVRPEANDRFYDFIRPRSVDTLVHRPACAGSNTYYIDRFGQFSYLRPTTAYQATKASKTFDLDDYLYERVPLEAR